MLRVEGLESVRADAGPLGLDLEVREGSITALLGPNGAGKTTTLRAILGSLRPWGGRIIYQGQEIEVVYSPLPHPEGAGAAARGPSLAGSNRC